MSKIPTKTPTKTPNERIGRWDRFKEISNERHVSEDHVFWDNVYYVTKIGFSVFLFLCILSSAVISKGALLLLTWNLYTPHNTTGNKLKTLDSHLNYTTNETKRQTVANSGTNVYYVWALFLMVVTPYFLTAVFCLLRILFKGKPKFRWIPLLLMLVTSTIHTVGFSIFVFSLLPTLDPFSGLWYCSSITFFPATLQAVFYSARKPTKKLVCFILNLISVFLVVTSIILWTVYAGVGSNPSLTGDKIALFFICPFLISVGWSENFLPPGEPMNDTCTFNNEGETQPEDMSSENQSQKSNTITERLRVIGQEIQESGYIIFLIVNIWKILWTFFMVLIIFGSSCDEGSKCVDVLLDRENKDVIVHLSSKAFGNTWLYHGRQCELGTAFIIAVVGLFSSFFCQRLCVGAIKIVAQIAVFYLPLVLTTPVTFGVAAVIIGTLSDSAMCSFPFPWWDGNLDIGHWLLIFFAGLTGYISLIFTTTFLWNNSVSRMEREYKLFSQPLYCGALFDQSMLLNRKRDYKPEDENEEDSENETDSNSQDQETRYVKPKEVPLLYLCATMWHENETEMTQILTSLFRMDIDQCVRSLTHAGDGDYYKFEAHIFFDDAFQSGTSVVGEYVEMFKQVIEKTASYFYPKKFALEPPKMYSTPYGGRFVYRLPGENLMYVHLKDKTKIRNKKRWSQVMYMYYFLSHKIDTAEEDPKEIEQRAKNTFILALDGDVDFRPTAVKLLVDRMKRNPLVGAACGRIHPIGDGPMVWYQKFEYAVSHWLIKSTEHVTGCVLCSPGCFSLFRGSSLMQCNVMKKYTSMPTNGTQHIQYDQGEDRWLCTLLLKQGMKIDYCAASDAYTFAPEGFKEFYKQRRRWSPSTMANVLDILADWRNVTKKNTNMSMLYIMLQTAWFFSGVLTPGVLFLMIVGAINLAYPALSLHASLLINLGPIVLFVLVCFFAKEKHQLNFAAALSVVYSLVMMIVLVGLIKQSVDEGLCSITPIFSIFVAGVFVIAGLSHPKEFRCLLHGPLFFIAIPSMSMLLMLYSIINLNNVSWGTREVRKPEDKGKENKGGAESTARGLLDKLRLSCSCCTETKSSTGNEEGLAQKLDEITLRLKHIEENIQPNDHGDVRSTATTPHSAVKNLPVTPRPEAWAISPSPPKSNTKKTPAGTNFEAVAKLDSDEHAFWEWLIKTYLYPLNAKREETSATGEPVNVEEKIDVPKELRVLRNKATLAFLLLNALFITIIFFLQLANKDTAGQIAIKISCSNGKTLLVEPISVAFTIVFGVLLAIQFICMLLHRWKTFLQINSITPFRREINIEQLLLDAFEDIFEYQREKEAKKYKLSSSFHKTMTKHTFKSWLIKALKQMQVRVNKEEETRVQQQKGMKGIIAQHTQRMSFKNRVKAVRTLEKTLKVMKTEQVKNLKDCLTTAMKSLRENRQSQKKPGFGSVVQLAMDKNQSDTQQGKTNSIADVVVEHERRSTSRSRPSPEEEVTEREKNDKKRDIDNDVRPTSSRSKVSKSRIEQGPEEKQTKEGLRDGKRMFEKSVRQASRTSSLSKSRASSRRSSTVTPTDALDVTDLSE